MKRLHWVRWVVCLAIAGGGGLVRADERPADEARRVVIVDPAKAVDDADFAIQGEYSGTLATNDGDLKYGVQVVALGGGRFNAVAYPGGLPGDGWNGVDKIYASGKTADGVTRLVSDQGSAVWKDNALLISDSGGTPIGSLKKVHRKSPTLGAKPPEGAIVLFDGKVNRFEGRVTEDGLLMQGATSKPKFQDFQLHLEFRLAYMPYARGQRRSNSGCYLQGRYEVQILDSFGLEGRDNECGGIYSVRAPSVNMCFPPLSWQTYDIDFTAARYDDSGKKVRNARVTVRHNGVVIHNDVELPHATRGNPVKEGAEPGPIFLQDHGDPLRFRNIWVVVRK